jgi:D-threo-aldose 1-dehydrogenase
MTIAFRYGPAQVRPLGRTGLDLSLLGFGGTATGRLVPDFSEADAAAILDAAWARGMRYFDTSPFYGLGLSEHRMGAFLRHQPRDTFLLSTKVGRLLSPDTGTAPQRPESLPFEVRFDYSYGGTMRSFEDSLQRLGLARIDLLILHDISPRWHGAALEARYAEAMTGAQRALTDLRAQGVVRAIGVGVNDVDVCSRCLVDSDFDFFMLAGRLTLLDHTGLPALLNACTARGVAVLSAAPFNSGILATGAVPGARYFYAPAEAGLLDRTRAIEAICRNHSIPLGAAALQFALGHAAVTSIVPSFRSVAEFVEVCAWMETPIPLALWQELHAAGLLQWTPARVSPET